MMLQLDSHVKLRSENFEGAEFSVWFPGKFGEDGIRIAGKGEGVLFFPLLVVFRSVKGEGADVAESVYPETWRNE